MTATITEQMATAYFAITNVQHSPEAAERLARFGYTSAKLEQGLALHETAKQAIRDQLDARIDYKRATLAAHTARSAAWAAYQNVGRVARAVVKPHDPLLLTDLGLNHAMPRGSSDFMAAATQLFAGIAATPQVAALLAEYGYAPPALAAEQEVITAYRTALHHQQSMMAQAHRATRAQQTALRTLMRWISQYRLIASVAFSDDPTLLGLLTIQTGGRRLNRQDAKDAKTGEEGGEIENGEWRIEKNQERAKVEEGNQAMHKPENRTGEDDPTPNIQQQE